MCLKDISLTPFLNSKLREKERKTGKAKGMDGKGRGEVRREGGESAPCLFRREGKEK